MCIEGMEYLDLVSLSLLDCILFLNFLSSKLCSTVHNCVQNTGGIETKTKKNNNTRFP